MSGEWRSIQGWLSELEADTLQRICKGQRVLEFGCWKGKSAICMAETALSVLTVDHFKGDQFAGPYDTSQEAVHNISNSPYNETITLFITSVREAIRQVSLEEIDVIYYDADHTFEATDEFLQWIFATGFKGPILVHDYDRGLPQYQGLISAFHKFVIQTNRIFKLYDTLALAYYVDSGFVPPDVGRWNPADDILSKLLGKGD